MVVISHGRQRGDGVFHGRQPTLDQEMGLAVLPYMLRRATHSIPGLSETESTWQEYGLRQCWGK